MLNPLRLATLLLVELLKTIFNPVIATICAEVILMRRKTGNCKLLV